MLKKCTLNIIREELEKPLTLKEFEEVLEEITRDLTNRLVILELRQLGDEFGVLPSFYATSIATTLIAIGGAAKIPQEMVLKKWEEIRDFTDSKLRETLVEINYTKRINEEENEN